MEKIVQSGMKLDLHIHSQASSSKDGATVKDNTEANISILIDKLNHNQVNICAITDHDAFSYTMYMKLKEAETQDNSILKVLPGVEFSVYFEADAKSSIIHIVAIFSDKNNNDISKIESILEQSNYDKQNSFSETEFLKILQKINIDTILIAHQKNSLSSKGDKGNDANSLGNNKFLEFVHTDYFEAFEFRNRRNEIPIKSYIVDNNLDDNVSFVTGTDCHNWSAYPEINSYSGAESNFPYTYAKCLPTFKGLVMAMTDHSRLKRVNSFFNVTGNYVDSIDLTYQNTKSRVSLSRGINAIIGDNSIGKSMLLHAMTGYMKPLNQKIKAGYQKYLKENGIKIDTKIPEQKIFIFDMQGEVRAKFEENKLDTTIFLKNYFPVDIDPRPYRAIVDNEINRMIDYLKKKFSIDSKIADLKSFNIVISNDKAESLTFNNQSLQKSKLSTDYLTKICSKIDEIIVGIEELAKMKLEEDDITYISNVKLQLSSMKQRYNLSYQINMYENSRIERIATVIAEIAQEHTRKITDTHKERANFSGNTDRLIEDLNSVLCNIRELEIYNPQIEEKLIPPNSKTVLNYEFISKLNIEKIDTEYIKQKIKSPLRAGREIDWRTIDQDQLKSMLPRYDGDTDVIVFLKDKIQEMINRDFQIKKSIIEEGKDKYAEMSSGLNSKIYFDLLSYEDSKDGIYIIDQPEDNISQNAIRTELLERFKMMREHRQVIIVTHNPQFIVNLDIDNLIYMTKENNILQVKSGALEYESDDYNVLKIVADNIDGGLESIRKRWKRYEKNTEFRA